MRGAGVGYAERALICMLVKIVSRDPLIRASRRVVVADFGGRAVQVNSEREMDLEPVLSETH